MHYKSAENSNFLHFYSAICVYLQKYILIMDKLYESFNKLLKITNTDFIRYKYAEINWDSHMLGLVGPRGIGKTTMFLQHIKQNLHPKDTL